MYWHIPLCAPGTHFGIDHTSNHSCRSLMIHTFCFMKVHGTYGWLKPWCFPMFSIYTISGVCQFSLETTPTKIGRNPASPRFTKGTCYLPILKSLGMAFPMVTRCLWWIPILNGKTRHQTPPFPPPKKKLRKKLPLKNADWGSLSLLLNAFSQVTFVHFQGGNF